MDDSGWEIIHVLNKNSMGGAESLVKSLVSTSKKGTHKVFFIANSCISKYFLTKSRLRILVILKTSIILFIKLLQKNEKKYVYVFHLAECHLIFQIISNLLPVKKMPTGFICYFHQSPELYPTKLRRFVKSTVSKSDGVIFYSSQVKKAWDHDFLHGENYKSVVIHNFVSDKFFSAQAMKIIEKKSYFQAIFVGRNIYWKRPELAYKLAQKIAQKNVNIKIKFLGLSQTDGQVFLEKTSPSNLSVEFCGKVENPINLLLESDIMFYLVDQDVSKEGVGIAAMEALVLGVPVLISSKYKSDFFAIEQLIDFTDFSNKIANLHSSELLEYLRSFKKIRDISIDVNNLFSLETYHKEFLVFVSEIFLEKDILQ